ncbi:MAG: ornithine cyclodeaminase family protein [Flavobacteriales bacterium]|nr:ornithine cyclodeaminase family protein [Flavobacteriales bacterium]
MPKLNNKTLVFSREDIHEIVKHVGLNQIMDELIHRLEIAIKSFDPSTIHIPIRSGFNYTKPDSGLVEWMPLYNELKGDVVIKLVGYHPNNPDKHQIPSVISTISSYDTTTGQLKGIMDGVLLTAFRTGAASAVCSKYLAKPESKVLGLIGCGAQAVTQLHALSRIFNIEKVLIRDVDTEAMISFGSRCEVLNLDLEIETTSLEELVGESDIICTATSIEPGAGPLFSHLKTKASVHINAVGADFPNKVELPLDLLRNSFVCPDFLEQAKIEGECQKLEDHEIDTDLAHLIQNEMNYADLQNQMSVFDSTGWVVEDNVVMDLFMEYGKKLNLGQYIEIESLTGDAKSPYDFINESVVACESNEKQIR